MSKKKVQFLVTVPYDEKAYSKRAALGYVREAVKTHGGAFDPGHPMFEGKEAITVKEYKGEPVIAEAPPTISTIQVFNEIVQEINTSSSFPPADIRQNRREYWKAGARATLTMVCSAVQRTAQRILGDERPQPTDGEMFVYWITQAERSPSKMAQGLARCITPQDYRKAIAGMMEADGIKLTTSTCINPEGSVESL